MRVMTVLGTRPEIIRLRNVIDVLDANCDHVLVHTGQNFDDRLSGLFFRELELRDPDMHLGIQATNFAEQAAAILTGVAEALEQHRPDALLILGDTNTGLAAIVAKRMGVPVYHMEAGNRCFDDTVPEEVNRRVIDHSSSVLMPYTHRSAANLVREGIERQRVYVTGNPIKEIVDRFGPQVEQADPFTEMNLQPGQYLLATVHRAETTDVESRLRSLTAGLERVSAEFGMPIVCSLHPRTADRMTRYGLNSEAIRFVQPLGFFDFIRLERDAFCVLSDSGTVQEECCILGVPSVTLRDVTERPETIECGSNILSGVEPDRVLTAAKLAVDRRGGWTPPAEYLEDHVSETVARIILGLS